MILTIELPPELETELQEVAARRGQDPATFATVMLANTLRDISKAAAATTNATTSATELNGNGTPLLSLEELDAALDELAALGADIPPSNDPDIYSRENIYFDHD